jgi:hypothetical protein
LVCGGYHHHNNHDYANYDTPLGYDGQIGSPQSNEHLVWYHTYYPAAGWYRLRFDCQSPFRPTWASTDKGAQFAIWRPIDLQTGSVYNSNSPRYTTGGGFNDILMSEEVYIYVAMPGHGLVSFDGYGTSVGKYYVSFERTFPLGKTCAPLPNPTYAPFNAEQTIIIG